MTTQRRVRPLRVLLLPLIFLRLAAEAAWKEPLARLLLVTLSCAALLYALDAADNRPAACDVPCRYEEEAQ